MLFRSPRRHPNSVAREPLRILQQIAQQACQALWIRAHLHRAHAREIESYVRGPADRVDLAQDYVARGMTAYVDKVQEPEFAARERGYTFVSHQQEVGTGYFDDVTTTIQGGRSSVTALTGSTEEEQFH